jgi:hypothetical protein
MNCLRAVLYCLGDITAESQNISRTPHSQQISTANVSNWKQTLYIVFSFTSYPGLMNNTTLYFQVQS